MLSSIRKFSTSFLGKVVIALIAIAFVVGFGFSGSFSGKQNIVAEINDEKISTQEFVNYLRTVNITYEDMERVGKYNLLERVLTNYISEKIVAIESKKKGFQLSDKSLFGKLSNDKRFKTLFKFASLIAVCDYLRPYPSGTEKWKIHLIWWFSVQQASQEGWLLSTYHKIKEFLMTLIGR